MKDHVRRCTVDVYITVRNNVIAITHDTYLLHSWAVKSLVVLVVGP